MTDRRAWNVHLAVLTFSLATVGFVVGYVRGDNWILTLGWLIAAIVMGRIAWTLNAD